MVTAEPVGYLCTHGAVPEVIRPGLECSVGGDVPVRMGAVVVTEVRYTPEGAIHTAHVRGP